MTPLVSIDQPPALIQPAPPSHSIMIPGLPVKTALDDVRGEPVEPVQAVQQSRPNVTPNQGPLVQSNGEPAPSVPDTPLPALPQHGPALAGTPAGKPSASPHLLGTWFGIRPKLEEIGITPSAAYFFQPAVNVNGGKGSELALYGQFVAGATVDLDKVAGLEGGVFQVQFSNRHGKNLNQDEQLGLLQNPQGVIGAGEIWRLSQLYYRQTIGKVELQVGRNSVGADFGSSPCFFEGLYWCGNTIGHIASGYWFNPPVSVWGARVKVGDKLGYTMAGIYENNPRNLNVDHGIYLGFKGRTGVLLPIERGFTVKLGGDPKLAGVYTIGFWYDTSRSTNLVKDSDGNFAAISGEPFGSQRGRYGAYVVARQQLRAGDADGRGGIVLQANAVFTDPRTTQIQNIFQAGATYTGLFAARPTDEIGFAIGRTRVNHNVTELQQALNGLNIDPTQPPRSEYAMELDYSINAAPGLSIRPNVQWYLDPGGRSQKENIVVVGASIFLTL